MGALASDEAGAPRTARRGSRIKRAFRWANEHSAIFTVLVGFLTFVASTGIDVWRTPAETAVLEAEARETEERTRASRQASVREDARALHDRVSAYERALGQLTPEEQRLVAEARSHEAAAQGSSARNDFPAAEARIADGYAALAGVRTPIGDLPEPPSGQTRTPFPGAWALLAAAALAAVALRGRRRG